MGLRLSSVKVQNSPSYQGSASRIWARQIVRTIHHLLSYTMSAPSPTEEKHVEWSEKDWNPISSADMKADVLPFITYVHLFNYSSSPDLLVTCATATFVFPGNKARTSGSGNPFLMLRRKVFPTRTMPSHTSGFRTSSSSWRRATVTNNLLA